MLFTSNRRDSDPLANRAETPQKECSLKLQDLRSIVHQHTHTAARASANCIGAGVPRDRGALRHHGDGPPGAEGVRLHRAGASVPESAGALAATIPLSRCCKSSSRLLAGQSWLYRCTKDGFSVLHCGSTMERSGMGCSSLICQALAGAAWPPGKVGTTTTLKS